MHVLSLEKSLPALPRLKALRGGSGRRGAQTFIYKRIDIYRINQGLRATEKQLLCSYMCFLLCTCLNSSLKECTWTLVSPDLLTSGPSHLLTS